MSARPVTISFQHGDPLASYRLAEDAGDAPLIIDLTIRNEHEDPLLFLTLLASAKDRWQEFRLHIVAREFSTWCLNLLKSISDLPAFSTIFYVPSLTRLSIKFPVHVGHNLPPDQLNYFGAPVNHLFFQDWSAPALRSIELENNFPTPIRDAINIAICRLSFNTSSVHTWGILPLSRYFSDLSCRDLTYLLLDFEQTEFAVSEQLPHVRLQNLRKLDIRLTDCDTPLRFLRLCSALSIPNIDNLKLLVSLDMLLAQAQEESVVDWINALLAPGHDFRTLRKFTMQVHSPGEHAVAPLRQVFERCPNLRNLTISGNLHPPPAEQLPYRLPPLRKLKLLDSWNFDMPFVEHIQARLVLDPETWEEFELIKVQDCPFLHEDELQRLFPPHKVEVLETMDEMQESD